jgi:signal transduction histidine kinase/DNA-binding response OmpR family regulator
VAEERRTDPGLREFVARAEEGFAIVAPDRTVRIMNEAAERMLGLERAEVVGRPYPDPGILDELECVLDSDDHEPREFELEALGRRLHGTITPYLTGGDAGAVLTLRDDTAIVHERERADAILSATGDGIVVFAPDGRCVRVNEPTCLMLDVCTAEEVGDLDGLATLLGLPAGGLEVPSESPAGYDNADGDATLEIEIEKPKRLVLHVHTEPIHDARGHVTGSVVMLRDVTADADLMQMKNEFVSTVSHELRTPLTSIKGYIDLILDGDAGDVDDMQREFLGIVKENTDRLVELINDMLDISRIESGRIHLKVAPLDLRDSIAGAADTFGAVLDQRGHKLICEVTDDLPLAAGDRDRVGQVLINFISNAVKYSPEGGTVTVRAVPDGDQMIRVTVTDEGIGIGDEDLGQMFTQFFRVDSAMTREIGGTGLGLSICKSIIDLLGGTIGVQSALGEGSTFYFTLPVVGPDLVRTPSVEGPTDQTGGKVLVIDADPDAAALIETYLARHGYDVVKAYTAIEAIEKAVAEKPDVITLDVVLKDTDGFDLMHRFKEMPETADTPVVVLSVICDEGRSCRLGAANYLEKPIDRDRLVRIIKETLGPVSSPLVLVVDDDRDIVDMLKHTLQGVGFAVSSAYDGREAMAAVEANHPDLIMLDLKMPEMDGYEVIQALKHDPARRDIPILVMTAHQLDSERIDLIEMTAAQVAKPFEPGDLAGRVAEILNREVIAETTAAADAAITPGTPPAPAAVT